MKTLQHIIRSACANSRLTIVVLLCFLTINAMATGNPPPQDSLQRTLTVAKVYEEKDSDPGSVQVTFYESARFYKILKTNPKYAACIALLKEAIKKRRPVCVRFAEQGSDIIDSVSRIKKPAPGGDQ